MITVISVIAAAIAIMAVTAIMPVIPVRTMSAVLLAYISNQCCYGYGHGHNGSNFHKSCNGHIGHNGLKDFDFNVSAGSYSCIASDDPIGRVEVTDEMAGQNYCYRCNRFS